MVSQSTLQWMKKKMIDFYNMKINTHLLYLKSVCEAVQHKKKH